jgi:predicted hydrocarbon binding protein
MTKSEQKTSGINFIHIREFIGYKWGQDGLDIYNKHGNFKFDDIYEEKLYPFEDYVDILSNVQEIFEDEQFAFKLGWHRGRNILLGINSLDDRLNILSKVMSSWKKFNNFGEVSIKKHDKSSVSVVISNYDSHPIYCERMRGFFSGLICGDLKGSCSVKEKKCVCKGKTDCEFVIEIE